MRHKGKQSSKKSLIEIDPDIIYFTHSRIRPFFTGITTNSKKVGVVNEDESAIDSDAEDCVDGLDKEADSKLSIENDHNHMPIEQTTNDLLEGRLDISAIPLVSIESSFKK